MDTAGFVIFLGSTALYFLLRKYPELQTWIKASLIGIGIGIGLIIGAIYTQIIITRAYNSFWN